MQPKSGKRSRSPSEDTLNNNKTQCKVLVTQKISDASDPEKMKQIYEKTRKLLFDGAAAAAAAASPNSGTTPSLANGATTDAGDTSNSSPAEQFMQYALTGNGEIAIRNMANNIINPHLDRKRSLCCHRLTLIHDRCGNCTEALCEECGYSCRECSAFICRACVTVFGNHFNEVDEPLCERCQMYTA